MGRVPIVAVIGAADASNSVVKSAEFVGRAIAERKWHLVCGGKSGVMEAVCRGFRFGRNELNPVRLMAIGVLPEDNTDYVNDYVDIAIPTGMGIARNAIITRMADGVIAVGGSSGTLSELAFAWQMGKKIAALGETGGWSEKLAGTQLDDRRVEPIYNAVDADDAVQYLSPFLEDIDDN